MNDKVTEIDIAKRLNEQMNVSESIASDYISTYFSLIREGLETDGVVKITGLGTFKLVLSESRKIVSVHTKEDQEIPSHYRITFTPDKELAVRLNEPYAHLTTVNLDEEDLREEPVEPIANAAKEYFDQEIHEIPLPIHAPLLNKEIESYVSDKDEEQVLSVDEEKPNEAVSPEDVPAPVVVKPKNGKASSMLVICATCLLTLVVFLFFYFVIPYISDKEELQAQPELAESVTSEIIPVVLSDSLVNEDSIANKRDTVSIEPPVQSALANETIKYGSRLTLLARKYYGNKHFWCYIYEENKSHIANPNLISIGTKIVIPHPSKYGIDANSTTSVEKAKNFSKELNSRIYPE